MMNSIDIQPDEALRLRPYAVGDVYFPPVEATPSMSSSNVTPQLDKGFRLVFDLRIIEGRRLLAEDARLFGPISPDLLNEVRAKWPD
jgi:hypothetical protein